MHIANSVALVTGASRGLGRHFVTQLLERGATKVYATARNPESVDLPGAEVLTLDITDPVSVAAVAKAASDVTLLVNNAGINTMNELVSGDLDAIEQEMNTAYYGPLRMIRAFAPILKAAGGGAIVNVLSAASWVPSGHWGAYHAAKAAAWSLTNSVRLELSSQNTLVTGVYMGPTDTGLTRGLSFPFELNDPADIVRAALDGVEANQSEVIADPLSAQVKAQLALDPATIYTPAAPTA
ncbi:SDR family oxidoreductase [Streptomyces sp. NPDC050704]|uniref:SDR family oxidoreductase n=1 Tax=Streptomyces sp. NPDC050704 TaxID=3157219 RepID=UPI0034444B6C